MNKEYYNIKARDAVFDYALTREVLRELLRKGELTSEKRGRFIYLSTKEIEGKLNLPKLRVQNYELREVDTFLTHLTLLLSNFKEFERMSDEDYDSFSIQMERIVREFFKGLYKALDGEEV